MPKILIIVVIAALAGYFGFNQYFAKTEISSDVTLPQLTIEGFKTLVVKNGARITVEGNTTINGKIECEGGPLYLVSKKDLTVNGKLDCSKSNQGIIIVAEGKVEFTAKTKVQSGGSIQLVDSVRHIADKDELARLFDETGMDSDDGKYRLGPLFPEEEKPVSSQQKIEQLFKDNNIKYQIEGKKFKYQIKREQSFNLVKEVYARGKADIIIKGDWVIPTPPPGVNLITFFNFPGRSVELDGSITGPDGRDGQDISTGCFIDIPAMEKQDEEKNQGKKNKEKDAFRTRIRSGKIYFANFTMKLGNGGRGGNATTDKDCDPGIAIAGTGGKPSNLKVTADEGIIIEDSFTILPGKGGKGGKAIAYGKKGDPGNPGEHGGDAFAFGGGGGDNIKFLKAQGQVEGLDKLFLGSVVGGDGGDAVANPGDGGDGNVCDARGGWRGFGFSQGGKGGVGLVNIQPLPVKRTGGAKDENGKNGQKTENTAKLGQNGPPCAKDQSQQKQYKTIPSPKPSGITPSVPKIESTPKASWEFLRLDKSYEKTSTLKLDNAPIHLVVATSGSPDVRTLLPISIVLKVDGKEEFKTIISGDPKLVCRDATGCSTDGPVMKSEWKNRSIELSAYDKNGNLLVKWTE